MNTNHQLIQQLVRQTDSIIFNPALLNQTYTKGPGDYVTLVDKQVQAYLQDALRSHYPHIQFMGEEKDNQEINPQEDIWILDPIDGTTNLIQNCNFSAVSLGLWSGKEQKVILGIIYQPFAKELFYAADGKGAYLNGTPIHVSSKQQFDRCVISAGTTPYYKEHADEVFDASKEVFKRCADIRRTGSAALDMAYVACGRLDGYFEKILSPWDYAAGYLLIKEAGGITTNYENAAPAVTQISSICCGNPYIQPQLLQLAAP